MLNHMPTHNSIPIRWVKKIFNQQEYNKFYKDIDIYCFLKQTPNGPLLGFNVPVPFGNKLPDGCSELTLQEMRDVDNYRRAHNISPTPFEEKNYD